MRSWRWRATGVADEGFSRRGAEARNLKRLPKEGSHEEQFKRQIDHVGRILASIQLDLMAPPISCRRGCEPSKRATLLPMNAGYERFQTALDLWVTAVALRRQALRREHPDASDTQIQHLLHRWLTTRPGAEYGDGPQPATGA
ncbi:MAG: hypothetical protein K2Y23_05150 [Cyanobacteria bacterium]|nr:hypothetical protein [Cyanobacteriota bacterium]